MGVGAVVEAFGEATSLSRLRCGADKDTVRGARYVMGVDLTFFQGFPT